MGVSENSVPHCTQWFCWSLCLWKMAISLGIYPTFSDKPIVSSLDVPTYGGLVHHGYAQVTSAPWGLRGVQSGLCALQTRWTQRHATGGRRKGPRPRIAALEHGEKMGIPWRTSQTMIDNVYNLYIYIYTYICPPVIKHGNWKGLIDHVPI